jgi:hypothetical protein
LYCGINKTNNHRTHNHKQIRYTTRNEQPDTLAKTPILKITYTTVCKLINLQAIENCSVEHDLPVERVYGSDDNALTLYLLMCRIWSASKIANKWQMGFKSALNP